jgi:mono/diheme cytochrome c family protein
VAPTKVPPTDTPTAAPTIAPTPTATEQSAAQEVARPSNEGGPGPAINLKGDPKAGEQVYKKICQTCHGDQGKGGVVNKGSDDGTVPPLNPIDSTLIDKDPKTYATNIDLFLEHGSTPEGDNPEKLMLGYGDKKLLTPQQIADVIAYIISLNPAQ